jgi:methionyl aminopeptidase
VQDLDTWRKAGKVAAEALAFGRGLVKDGANIREVCDRIDAKIVELGARPAWPSQVGLDHVAAHATPDAGDDAVFDGNVVCLDVGAHIDGCIGDNAATVDLSGQHAELLKASEEALENAIRAVGVGVALGEIGRVIEETIASHGLQPVRNLSGHGISRWVIHDAPTIPNHDTKDKTVLKGDQVIAIEPFVTDGAGSIQEHGRGNIFAVAGDRPIRSPAAREVLAFAKRTYRGLPFTSRWIAAEFGAGKARLALAELLRNGNLHAHPPLAERSKGMVAVFEKSMYVGEKVEVLTRVDG